MNTKKLAPKLTAAEIDAMLWSALALSNMAEEAEGTRGPEDSLVRKYRSAAKKLRAIAKRFA